MSLSLQCGSQTRALKSKKSSEEEIRCVFDDNFTYFFIKTYIVGAH